MAEGMPIAQFNEGTLAMPMIVGVEGSSIANPYTPAGKPGGTMKDNPGVPCWVVETTVVLARTRACQLLVPAGIRAILAVFVASVKAPANKMDCPGAVSRETQKIALAL